MNKNLKRRAEDVAKAERELEEIENTLLRLEEETRAVLARVGANLLAGAISEPEADRLREQAEGELVRLRRRADVLRQALPEFVARREAAEEAERASKVEKRRDELRHAVANRERALRQFAARTREVNAAAAEVGRHREFVNVCVEAPEAMRPSEPRQAQRSAAGPPEFLVDVSLFASKTAETRIEAQPRRATTTERPEALHRYLERLRARIEPAWVNSPRSPHLSSPFRVEVRAEVLQVVVDHRTLQEIVAVGVDTIERP
ncbi:MAG: hypothetical protein WKF65_02120 [Gaiellaceae bacterium]